jgi:adenosylcobinamide-phosphate synthase
VASLIALVALLIEAALGYPDRLTRAIGHPVTWIGAIIAGLEGSLNRPAWSDGARRALGGLTLLAIMALAGGAGLAIEAALQTTLSGTPFGAGHVAHRQQPHRPACPIPRAGGATGLPRRGLPGGLAAGRQAVAHIVGRDPDRLDEAGVARAAIESLAENFSDGVVAPALWMAVGGLGAAAAYKAVNTADSMIGHLDARHAAFGWAAARCDDLVNLPASRLCRPLLWPPPPCRPARRRAMPGGAGADAGKHRSPMPAGRKRPWPGRSAWRWPGRAAMAASSSTTPMGAGGRREADAADICRALRLYVVADLLLVLLVALLALAAAGNGLAGLPVRPPGWMRRARSRWPTWRASASSGARWRLPCRRVDGAPPSRASQAERCRSSANSPWI